MIAIELPARTGPEAVRVVQALDRHRYVEGRVLAVHALAVWAIAPSDLPAALLDARAWAEATLKDPSVDPASKDPLLERPSTIGELVALLTVYWTPGDARRRAVATLRHRLTLLDCAPADHEPFDEAFEDDIHPLLVDAGWELRSLASLDPALHRGAIEAYAEPILFEAARFEEESAIPKVPALQELPALGPVELLDGIDDHGALRAPLVLWTSGDETYQDYVVRGVLRAAKLA